MYTKESVQKFIRFIMAVVVLLVSLAVTTARPASAQEGELEQAVAAAILANDPSIDREISVSVIQVLSGEDFGTASIHAPGIPGAMPDIILFIGRYDAGAWTIGLENTELYLQLLSDHPGLVPLESQAAVSSSIDGNGSAQLSLPWPIGQSWAITGGPHQHVSGQVTRSSLDFNIGGGGNGQVVAARDGTAYYSPSCPNLIRIDHADGWQTKYYHVKDIAVYNGQPVSRGQFLGHTSAEFGCGGYATGNHVHLALMRSNEYQTINGHDIGGWTVSQGANEYYGCMSRGDTVACASSAAIIYNDGTAGSMAPSGETIRYAGSFSNPTYGSGSLIIDLVLGETTLSGYVNFTNAPGTQALCGAGALSGTRNGNALQFSFISADSDPGCTYDDGQSFNMSGQLSGRDIVNGVYSVNNAQGGTFTATRTARYEERFTNPQYGSGTVIIDIGYLPNAVAGYMNFTNDPGVTALCGAGSFYGAQSGANINFGFISNDPDAGCTFDDGLVFNVNAQIIETRLVGNYTVNNGQGGTINAAPNGEADHIVPTGQITSPQNDAVFGPGAIGFSADAWDNMGGSGVGSVYFWANYALPAGGNGIAFPEWHLIGSPTGQPYGVSWSTPATLHSQVVEVGIHVEDNNGNYCINPKTDFTCYDLNSKRTFVYIESINNPGVIENWIPENLRAYLNQMSLGENNNRKCSGASAAMYLAMEGFIRSDQIAMANMANQIFTRLDGSYTASRLAGVMSSIPNLQVTAQYYNPTEGFNRIKAEIDNGQPVILLSTKLTSEHYIVIVGYRILGDQLEVIAYDPYGRWTGVKSYYDANSVNTTDVESAKGRWVYYPFDEIWGCDFGFGPGECRNPLNLDKSWIITDRSASLLVDEPMSAASLSNPDLISLEPTSLVVYGGQPASLHMLFIPLIKK